jgi:hypothetical protein
MPDLTRVDRDRMLRARRLVRQEIRDQQARDVTDALYELAPDAILYSVRSRRGDPENGEPHRVVMTVHASGKRRKLTGYGKDRYTAMMNAIQGGWQRELVEDDDLPF